MEPPRRGQPISGGPSTARGGSINTDDQIGMQHAYQTNNKFHAQISQRKSRGKPQGQSVEPPSLQNSSINGIASQGWQGNKKGATLVQSPGLNTTYTSN